MAYVWIKRHKLLLMLLGSSVILFDNVLGMQQALFLLISTNKKLDQLEKRIS